VTDLLQQLLHVPEPVVLSAIAAMVFGEAAFFLGFVVPGETAVLLGGFLASTGRLSVVLLSVVVVAAAIVGDSVGYEVGRRAGPRMLRTRMLAKHEHRVEAARAFLDGRGASAVFIGRFTAFLRALTPGLAGLSRMRYRRFLAWNALGGLVWGVGAVVAGYLAGSSYRQVAHHLGQGGAVGVAVVVAAALFVWHRRRRRHRAADREGATHDDTRADEPSSAAT
jgi:membrane protein DedA with SNARE-associated domain